MHRSGTALNQFAALLTAAVDLKVIQKPKDVRWTVLGRRAAKWCLRCGGVFPLVAHLGSAACRE